MQSTACSDGFDSGPQPKVISVAQDDPRIEFRFQRFKADSLDRACGAHRHEDRSFDLAAAGGQKAGARFAFASDNFEIDRVIHFKWRFADVSEYRL